MWSNLESKYSMYFYVLTKYKFPSDRTSSPVERSPFSTERGGYKLH